MMKNAKTKLDHIVAKYNYTAQSKDSPRKHNKSHTVDGGRKSGKAVFFEKRNPKSSKPKENFDDTSPQLRRKDMTGHIFNQKPD